MDFPRDLVGAFLGSYFDTERVELLKAASDLMSNDTFSVTGEEARERQWRVFDKYMFRKETSGYRLVMLSVLKEKRCNVK